MSKLVALVSLLLALAPVMACWGPDCTMPDDGTIDTYFSGSGHDVYFNDILIVDEWCDDDKIVEDVWTDKGSVTVLQNINMDDGWWFFPTEVVLNKIVTVDPASFWCFSEDANVEKYVTWDDGGSVFRSVTMGDVTHQVSVGADEGVFIDDLQYEGTIKAYESIGLNTENICDIHGVDTPDMPVCDWCD